MQNTFENLISELRALKRGTKAVRYYAMPELRKDERQLAASAAKFGKGGKDSMIRAKREAIEGRLNRRCEGALYVERVKALKADKRNAAAMINAMFENWENSGKAHPDLAVWMQRLNTQYRIKLQLIETELFN